MNRKFGRPSLTAANNGRARWVRGSDSPLDQKSPTGWLAELYGGVQSGDDYARVNIPASEMYPSEFKTALWTWYQTNAEVYGVNMVIWMHDPTDNDKRIEITQAPSGATLEKASGWNGHELNTATVQFFFYGENTTGTALTAGTQYAWTSFQTDTLFKHWTIYRVTLEWGWYSTGTFENAYVADIKLNNEIIPLEPTIAELMDNSTLGEITTVSVTKALEAAVAYTANDVLSETDTDTAGTAWTFDAIASRSGGKGYITKAQGISESESVTPRLTLFLFNATPTSELDDNAVNTAPDAGDLAKYIGKIDFPAMESVGTTDSNSLATPSTYGNLPLAFECASGDDALYGILVTRDAFTQTPTEDMTIKLTSES